MTILKRILVAGMILMFTGIAFGGGATEEADEGPITLTVWDFKYGETDGAGPVFEELDRRFMAENPNIIIDHVAQPSDDTYYQLLSSAVASQSGPDVALVHAAAQAWEFGDFFVDLTPHVADWRSEISDVSWSAVTQEGRILAMPITVQGFGMYYNKALFEQAGLDPDVAPSDVEDFFAAMDALQAAGITPFIDAQNPFPKSVQYLTRAFSPNAYPGRADEFATGEANFDDPAFVQILEVFERMRTGGYFSERATGMDYWTDARGAFMAGEGAIFFGLLSDIAHWKDFSDALGRDNVGFFPTVNLPGQPAEDRLAYQGAGIGWAVMDWTEHEEAAARYVSYYAREGAPYMMEQLGALVPNSEVDVTELDYPVLDDIFAYVREGATPEFGIYTPGAAMRAQGVELSSAWFSGAISFDEYVEQSQEALETARNN
jgi:ABC-type glycerol-3-phosphate transport system substrate-binding protein